MIGFIRKRLAKRKQVDKHRLQTMENASGLNLVSLGSEYGGWTFHDDGNLTNALVVSAGLGEDASFDIEFLRTYDARVILVDPTPRAIEHYNAITGRFGKKAECGFVAGGCQPAEAYALDRVSAANLVLEPSALWTENTRLKFFLPENPDHVSHSIVNFQNDYSQDTSAIEVPALTLGELCARHGIDGAEIKLLKLDIEGAEVEVLEQLASGDIRPRQICVEFDELNRPGAKAYQRVDRADAALRSAGYECVFGNGSTDFLYLRR